jgi:hypothetical protein
MPHFIHPFIFRGYLSGFHILSIVNSAAINVDIEVHFGIKISSVFGTCPAIRLLDHTLLFFLLFRNPHESIFD